MGTVTINSVDYPIYGDADGADDYLAAKIGSTWDDLTETVQSQALVSATRLIRSYLKQVTGEDVDPETNTDEALAQADYELAYALSITPALADAVNANGNQKRVKAGTAEVEYFRPTIAGRFPPQVQAFLNAWLADNAPAASALSVGMNSGDDQCSTITGHDYQLTEGY